MNSHTNFNKWRGDINMSYWYFIVPIFNFTVFAFLIYFLLKVHKLNGKAKKVKRNIYIVILVVFIFVGGFFSWRFTEIAIYPHIMINGQTFIWKGHHYAQDNSFSVNDVPLSFNLKKVAYEKLDGTTYANNLLHYVFFPYTLYEDKKNSKVLWVIGLMDYEKFDRID